MENKKEYTLGEAANTIAIKYELGTTLVTGHKAAYWSEAAELYKTKATEEFRKQLDNQEIIKKLMVDGHNKIAEELRKENEKLKERLNSSWNSCDIANSNVISLFLENKSLKESNKELVDALNHLTANAGLIKCVYESGETSLLYESYTKSRSLIQKSEGENKKI